MEKIEQQVAEETKQYSSNKVEQNAKCEAEQQTNEEHEQNTGAGQKGDKKDRAACQGKGKEEAD